MYEQLALEALILLVKASRIITEIKQSKDVSQKQLDKLETVVIRLSNPKYYEVFRQEEDMRNMLQLIREDVKSLLNPKNETDNLCKAYDFDKAFNEIVNTEKETISKVFEIDKEDIEIELGSCGCTERCEWVDGKPVIDYDDTLCEVSTFIHIPIKNDEIYEKLSVFLVRYKSYSLYKLTNDEIILYTSNPFSPTGFRE